MALKWILVMYFYIMLVNAEDGLEVLTKTRSSFLQKYTTYADVVIMELPVPQNILFASFAFVGDETDISIYGCTARDATVYMRYGAPPVINPDGSEFPTLVKNISRSHLYNFDFKTDKVPHYINISSPTPGSYYVAVFLSYSDPRNKAIKQQGLTPECLAAVDCTVHVKRVEEVYTVIVDDVFSVATHGNESIYYKVYVPDNVDYIRLTMHNLLFGKASKGLTVYVQNQGIPSKTEHVAKKTISSADEQPVFMHVWTEEKNWYYIEFFVDLIGTVPKDSQNTTFEFRIECFSSVEDASSIQTIQNKSPKPNNTVTLHNSSIAKLHNTSHNTLLYKDSLSKLYRSSNITEIMPYHQYNLLRESSTDNFLFSYELEDELKLLTPIPINLTSTEFITLRFRLQEKDVGGTLQYILAFKKRIKETSSGKVVEPEPGNHIVGACLSRGHIMVPVWPNKCYGKNKITMASLMINEDVKNSTVLIPFPETGIWYATFKLFCSNCQRCDCSLSCQNKFSDCLAKCERTCDADKTCNNCISKCKTQVVSESGCERCDCDGKCIRTKPCNTSVYFDVSSQACIQGDCGENGKCMLEVSDGIVFSTCICVNGYRGWGCTDNSMADPYWLVVLGLLLLVLSNLTFLPAVYVAYRRKYFIESICYFSICFFSTFYHACDAGDNLISFCLTRIASLQFADFFCALLAIWVTLIAIADLPNIIASICHITGAIILAYCTNIDKTALWIFALPAVTGVTIIAVSWYLKYRKVRQMFVRKRYLYLYLTSGASLVAIGLIIYTVLQTEQNYKYLHSMWHVIMAIAVLILLPQTDTFYPEPTI